MKKVISIILGIILFTGICYLVNFIPEKISEKLSELLSKVPELLQGPVILLVFIGMFFLAWILFGRHFMPKNSQSN